MDGILIKTKTKEKIMKKVICMVLAVLMSLVLIVGCAQTTTNPENTPGTTDNQGDSKDAKKWNIAVVPKQVGNTYFEAARAGVDKAGEELGVNAQFVGPNAADAAEQVSVIQDLISQGVDAICVSANDADSLTPVLTQAKQKGIVVIDWDSPADPSVVDLSVKEIDYKQFAEENWDQLVKYMGTDEGEYAILTSTLTAGTCNEWIKFGKEYAAEKYPNLKLVTDPVCTNESVQEAYTKTLDLLTTYPNLKGIIGFSSPAPIGAGQAISEQGKNDAIALVGTALPNDANEYLHEGAIDAALLWEPAKLGYLTVSLAKYLLEGGTLAEEIDAPGYGKVTVEDSKNVILGKPSIFTAENVDDFNF